MPELSELYTYACNDVRFARKDNLDAWITADKVNGAMFRSYPLFSFIPGSHGDDEPVRHGDFVIDIDTEQIACQDAIKILDWFQEVYSVEHEQWRVYLSGKKGVHLELDANILGTDQGHVWLPLGYKRLAKDIEGELQVKLDTSMYNRGTGKPYRQPNVMRDTGTCKRQILPDDLYEIVDEDEYKDACSGPGETWSAEDCSTNHDLAEKLAHYLDEAEQQQGVLAHVTPLSDDERDRLAIQIPACISILANATHPGRTGRTFNDIAMQLTAYAVSAGFDEQKFLSGCHVFIEQYPSSSLNTLEKRYANASARFRTMAANGNQHSCAGIKALGFPGFDCKQCHVDLRQETQLTAEIADSSDLAVSRRTLNIPAEIADPGGMISLGMEALSQPGLSNTQQYNLPVVLTAIAAAIGGKLTLAGVWPNLYNIKIGPTSTGKTTSDKAMSRAIDEMNLTGFYGLTDFASGPALMRGLVDNPVTMMVIDECTGIFKRYEQRGDIVTDGKRDALLELYSKSGERICRAYSDNKKNIEIDRPCLSLTGNATPVILDAIQQEDFHTGTLQRFDFWCYDGPALERGVNLGQRNEQLERFVEWIAEVWGANPGGGNLRQTMHQPAAVPISEEAANYLHQFSRDITAEVNQYEGEGDKGIVSRQYDLTLKYALVHYASLLPVSALGETMITVANLEYGKKVARMLAQWKLTTLREQVVTGEFHRRCETFKQAIAAVMRAGKRPTFKLMANRRAELKNWRRKDSEEVICILQKRGEIVLDDSKPKTAYLLARQEDE